ncbi:MAG: CYTH domain-containing protein [Pseudomonadota bacterium]|nr:CYTH domain-containing protein [Pseudomonadota bacterium]
MNRASTPDTIELELKLGLRDCGPSRVCDALYSVLGRVIPRQTDMLQNVYFDHKRLLHGAGVAIRTRSVDGSHEMTVKIREPDEGVLSQRREWNFPIDTSSLDYAHLESLDLPVSVVPVIQDRSLEVVFQNVFERTTWHVKEDDYVVMISLDRGSVQVDSRESQVSELELELLSGDVEQLISLGCEVSERLPAFMGVISKAERGDRLIQNSDPMDDPTPTTKEHWLHWLSRALDPLSGPAPDEAIRALQAVDDHEAIARYYNDLKRGDLPKGLARWMIVQSLESTNAAS